MRRFLKIESQVGEMGFPGGAVVKNPPASLGDIIMRRGFHPGAQVPWRRARQPTPVLLPGESHGAGWGMGHGDARSQTRLNDSALTHMGLQ